MADLSITAGNVKYDPAVSANKINASFAGASVTAGQPIYVLSGKAYPASSINATAAAAVGVALHAAGDGQPVQYIRSGEFNAGATVVVGQVYSVSNETGKIGPLGDRATGEYVSIIGYGGTTYSIKMIDASGVVTTGLAAGADL